MHDEYSQDDLGASLSQFCRLMAGRRHGRGETITTRQDRQAIMRYLASISPKTGRPRTVPHLDAGYCRCASCRHASGER